MWQHMSQYHLLSKQTTRSLKDSRGKPALSSIHCRMTPTSTEQKNTDNRLGSATRLGFRNAIDFRIETDGGGPLAHGGRAGASPRAPRPQAPLPARLRCRSRSRSHLLGSLPPLAAPVVLLAAVALLGRLLVHASERHRRQRAVPCRLRAQPQPRVAPPGQGRGRAQRQRQRRRCRGGGGAGTARPGRGRCSGGRNAAEITERLGLEKPSTHLLVPAPCRGQGHPPLASSK